MTVIGSCDRILKVKSSFIVCCCHDNVATLCKPPTAIFLTACFSSLFSTLDVIISLIAIWFPGKMVVWLLNAATTSTTTTGATSVITTTYDSTKTPVTSKPSAANISTYSNLVVILLSLVVSFRATRSVVRC